MLKAEDGIRDDLVTGVQTCALPIWLQVGGRDATVGLVREQREPFELEPDARRTVVCNHGPVTDERLDVARGEASPARRHRRPIGGRSEEGRVGKEFRTRVAPYA